jgi:biopolymer transport protein ExbD
MNTTDPQGLPEGSSMTSMIDVVFLLLIFFLCTLKFRVLEGRFETELPKGIGSAAGEVVDLLEPLELHVLNDAREVDGTRVRLGRGRSYPVATLPAVLAGLAHAFPGQDVLIHAGDGIAYGQVIAVVDACVEGGFQTLRFSG